MKTSRNAPCPCGSGKKYKKCCLERDEKVLTEKRQAEQAEQRRLVQYLEDLDALSNQANDLIRSEQWEPARQACEQLLDRFPEETDGDERFSAYHKARGDFQQAKSHAQAALDKALANPEKFSSELVADLREEIAYLDECIQAGRLVE